VERCTDLEAFLAAPIGKYLVGETWLYFYPTPRVSGFVLWGRLNETDLQYTTRITPRVHAHAAKPHVALFDVRRVEKVDNAAFVVAADYVKTHRAAIKESIARVAIVHGPGVLGAIAGGFFQIVKPPYPVEVFEEPLAAFQWLEVEGAAALIAELDALQAEAAGTTPLLRDLRSLLHARVREVSVADAARALGLSERSLQRRLTELDTSFQKEIGMARVRAAQTLLIDGDAKLTEIAFAVGCASLHHFSTMFRKVTGETPTSWRDRHRKKT
jgi:AraC-like DNA-binding protein